MDEVRIEDPEGRSLPGVLAPAMRASLLRLDRAKAMTAVVKTAFRALAGFVSAMKLEYADVELNLDVEPKAGLAGMAELDMALTDLLVAAGEAARAVHDDADGSLRL